MQNRKMILGLGLIVSAYLAIVAARFKPWRGDASPEAQAATNVDSAIAKRHSLTVGFLPVT